MQQSILSFGSVSGSKSLSFLNTIRRRWWLRRMSL